MTKVEPAVAVLSEALSKFLSPATGETMYLGWWSIDGFEVAVQREVGPHVWISSRWQPTGGVFAGIAIERYAAEKSRISNLNGNCSTLCGGNEARCLKFVGNRVQGVARAVRACALVAGLIPN